MSRTRPSSPLLTAALTAAAVTGALAAAPGDKNEDGRIDLCAIGTKGSRIYPTTGTVDRPYGTPETLRRTSDTTFKTVL
ncbi:hypothetical protein SNE510_07050 [Streptomyces sp. NE5-10]|uniref:hypothetical protein n=1 Tax=Streptomyces sp. NE5-10 TaxID=2759674 RepID=UPI0019046228|nr:hypothetical protein [Streptomyces sp. NE5-10]GHJ91186.1 hypothetical protein SNE510_07050 [Streptomyces sp. NE5-10]